MESNHLNTFAETEVLRHLKHYLPSQTPLKDFIHHNSLHAFQHQSFFDAIFNASAIFGYHTTLTLNEYRQLYENGRISSKVLDDVIIKKKGKDNLTNWKIKLLQTPFDENKNSRIGQLRELWKTKYKLNINDEVHPLLFRILSSYVDQGIALKTFPKSDLSFIENLSHLESNSYVSFFKNKSTKNLLISGKSTITDLLNIIVGNPLYFEQYLFDQQFSHRGWSGMISTLENRPDSVLAPINISLSDVIRLELLLEIDCFTSVLGNSFEPLCTNVTSPVINIFENYNKTSLHDVLELWQTSFEWSYYDEVLGGIKILSREQKSSIENNTAEFQAIFCIDEREYSLRSHLEHTAPHCETLGSPGFFGVEFYYQPEGAQFYDKLCPAPVTPKYLIKEYDVKEVRPHDFFYKSSHNSLLFGIMSSMMLGIASIFRIIKNLYHPEMSPAISNAFAHMGDKGKLTIESENIPLIENGLQIGFTVEEMTTRVFSLLSSIGLTDNFSELIYIVAHGSSSANNPHHGAHDCGACSGRPGSVNARVFAFMANHPRVRILLSEKGINIPSSTKFIGALHDTAADEIAFYDCSSLDEYLNNKHKNIVTKFESALDINAKERSRRFASIDTKQSIQKIRKSIKKRSVSLFEPRPELGHGTNTLCFVGRRSLTKGLFLDRRAFLNSYNYLNDLEGNYLTNVMRPLGPVCGGINLEYYFSRMDNSKLGAGTKLPHNVVGLIGVSNSTDGDLRPGLPWQMIEVHDPIRLLIVVEHFPNIVLKSIQSSADMYEWYINNWVHLIVFHPEEKEFYYFAQGEFKLYSPLTDRLESITDINKFLEQAKEMETNDITNATFENLPTQFYH